MRFPLPGLWLTPPLFQRLRLGEADSLPAKGAEGHSDLTGKGTHSTDSPEFESTFKHYRGKAIPALGKENDRRQSFSIE